jgi:hypothetical protein
VKLLTSQPANFNECARLKSPKIFCSPYPQIDGILSANDSMALGAIEALDAAKRKALVVESTGQKKPLTPSKKVSCWQQGIATDLPTVASAQWRQCGICEICPYPRNLSSHSR